MDNIHPFNDAGRRLLSALVGYQAGLSPNAAYKKTPEVVDESWAIFAEHLLREMARGKDPLAGINFNRAQ